MVFLVTISIFKHLGTGPTWTNGVNTFAQNCRDNWWSFLLYIQNYYSDFDYICLPQTWYLSADMQMFLLSPLIIIPITLNLRKSSGFMVSMIELLILNLFLIALPMCLKLFVQQYRNDYDTHSRLINYFIGMMLAVFMRAKQDKPFLYMIKKEHIDITNLVVWIVMLLGMLTTVMCYQEIQIMSDSHVSKSVFDPLMRPAWCIGLSWIVYSSYHGYGGGGNARRKQPQNGNTDAEMKRDNVH
ncbi:hypothetical protein NQ314_008368 [Rhamnusium bicolor]|uniref:Uncharacterized protein n=1 Tax=Rhamnusium bicolor TaxID=1586634 RepID=A0AAV8YCV1_9CUCU|nr:hypothetical protein NQ314_008368 [Rhamnusium bicolor]